MSVVCVADFELEPALPLVDPRLVAAFTAHWTETSLSNALV